MKQRWYWPLVGALILAVGVAVTIGGYDAGQKAAAAPDASQNWAPSAAISTEPMAPLSEAPCTVTGNTRTCQLWALPGSLSVLDGLSIPVWGFAGSASGPAEVPGPVIRATVGETLVIQLTNGIPGQNVSLAFPGHDIAPDTEGVAPGGTKSYTLTVPKTGTFLYEAGHTAGGARQVAMGLAGPLIVESGTPSGRQERILVLGEVDPAFNVSPLTYSMTAFRPKYWLINGKAWPKTGHIETAAGDTVLVRYLNVGVEHYSIGLLGLDQEIVAADGEALAVPQKGVVVPISPGQTVEALVRIPASAVSDTLYPLYNTSLHQHNNNQRLADNRAAFGGILTFLRVTTGAQPPVDVGPVASNVTVTPGRTNGAGGVVLSATLTDADSTVDAFEYFVDTPGSAGTGTLVSVGSPAASVTVDFDLSATVLSGWSSGDHTLYLRGRDTLGNWGSLGSVVLTLDKAGPVITGTSVKPASANNSMDVVVSATADDGSTGKGSVVVAEYRIASGTWQPMAINPANSTVAGLSATIPAASLPTSEGAYTVEVRAQDDLGNWSLVSGSAELQLDNTGPVASEVTLDPSQIDFTQPPTVGSVRLTATITDQPSGGVHSLVANAEAFFDNVGATGTGIQLFPSDGLFDEATEDVYFDIPSSAFGVLTPGTHQVHVVGKDTAGNVGPAGLATITVATTLPVDETGPTVSDLVASPNPTLGARSITLTAVATDTLSNVASAVWFRGTDPTKTTTYPMSASDGSFSAKTEALQVTIDVSRWGFQTHQLSVRARDANGNWGPITTIELVVNR